MRQKRNIIKLRHESNDASQSIFIFKKLLSFRFINVNNFQFNNEFVNFKSKNDKKNVNYLINDNVQKTCRKNIFHFDTNSIL